MAKRDTKFTKPNYFLGIVLASISSNPDEKLKLALSIKIIDHHKGKMIEFYFE